MQIHTVSLLGATGLIGQQLLQLLSQDSRYQHIRVLSRRPIAFSHPKVAVIILDFEDEQAVRAALAGKEVPPERLIVVYDDLDIPLGEIRVRKTGRPGTHKGMISIAGEIRTDAFPRIRIGIGPCPPGRDAADFVLEAFKRDEREDLEHGLEQAAEALEMILDGGIERAMTRFNHRRAMAGG